MTTVFISLSAPRSYLAQGASQQNSKRFKNHNRMATHNTYWSKPQLPKEYAILRPPILSCDLRPQSYTILIIKMTYSSAELVTGNIKLGKMMNDTFFYVLFIFNMSIENIVLCFVLRGSILIVVYSSTAWVLGWFICKAVAYLQGVSVSASINTLVAISVDRALAICYPLRCQITSRTCRSIIVVIWVFSLVITLPWAIFFKLEPIENTDILVCTEKWPENLNGDLYFVLAHMVMCYLFPLTIISICYILIWRKVWWRKLPGEENAGVANMVHRSKIKVIKMLLLVVILFALSWLPLYIIFARLRFGVPSDTEDSIIRVVAPIAKWLGASNSCINPILYAFFNNKFRAGFKAILLSHSCCSPLRLDARKSFTNNRHNLSSMGSKTSSKMSVFSSNLSTPNASEQRRKSVMVQIPLDHTGGQVLTHVNSPKKDVVSRRTSSNTLLYRQCIINNLNVQSSPTIVLSTTTSTTSSNSSVSSTHINGNTTPV
ncbi:unnamed protein product, partial [Meganyctiphanes norvegica]